MGAFLGPVILAAIIGFIIYWKLVPLLKSGPQAGLNKGAERGAIGVWSWWRGEKAAPLVQLKFRFLGHWSEKESVSVSFSFLTFEEGPFSQSVQLNTEFMELLVGSRRALDGDVQADFLFLDGSSSSQKLSLKKFKDLYQGVGTSSPYELKALDRFRRPDTDEIAGMNLSSLVDQDKKMKEEAEAARLEAERLAKEAAEKAAAEARAKQAAASAAKAPAGGGAAAAKSEVGPAKIGCVYGSSTGNTAGVAEQLKEAFGIDSFVIANITDITPETFEKFDNILIGIPTWHIGELQDDWAAFLPAMDPKKLKLKGKKFAIFGLGDGVGYPDTYVDAMEDIWEAFSPGGVELVGQWPSEGYPFEKSKALHDGKFRGLVLDFENQADKNDERISAWVSQVKGEMGL